MINVKVKHQRIQGGTQHRSAGVTVGNVMTDILAANSGRVRATIQACTANTETVFICFGDDAIVINTGIGLAPGQHYEIDSECWHPQQVRGICASGGQIIHTEESM